MWGPRPPLTENEKKDQELEREREREREIVNPNVIS